MRLYQVRFAVLSATMCFALSAASQDAASAGRDILKSHQDAVVTVQLVISQQFSMAGQSNNEEMTTEVTGTVIDPSGLTVLSLSETDPSSIFESMMGGGMMEGLHMESKLTDVEILLPGGKEIAAEVALRDADLDLIYVRPKEKPDTPLAHIDLAQSADADVLQQLVALSRLGRAANRAAAASFEYVQAVVERPRKFYVLGRDNTQSSFGCPVFELGGKLVGFVMIRVIPGTDSGGMMGLMMSGAGDNMLPIVLPAATIAQYVSQALESEAEPADAPEESPAEAP